MSLASANDHRAADARRKRSRELVEFPRELGIQDRLYSRRREECLRHTEGVYMASSRLGLRLAEGFRPDRWDICGTRICIAGAACILYDPRSSQGPKQEQ